ncbi:MATE family efflux transporter [Natronomonas halophila]|uniref:MATE family efflux transporter n=1 Tax=Natronomonas halophila TaxID=2747817 RepID=UPI0015B5B515|nr:MATE family efflux transporter [Natronomonas halophila]QLD85791.1 MATE family efflux transporter [Natronomonas halophila]
MKDRSVNVTDGDLFKPLLVLSAPIIGSQVLQVAYNLADTFWVGQLGADAVAALSYSWAIVFLMVSVGGGLTTAGTVLVSQHKGSGDFRQSHHVAGQTISFVTIVAVVFAAVGYVAAPYLLALIGATPGTAPHTFATDYTRVIFLGVVFMFWFFIFDALMRGWGDTRTPLYLMAGSATLNVVLDPFLILGFVDNPLFVWAGMEALQTQLFALTGFDGFGVMGAAIATVIARFFPAGIGMYLLLFGDVGLSPSPSDFLLKADTVKKILDIGAPTGAEQGMRAGGIAAMTAIIALAGDDAVAAYGIVNRLASLLFLPALGFARGTETVVGQNLGARQPERAKRAVLLAAATVSGAFLVVVTIAYPFAESITGVFLPPGEAASETVIEYGAAYIRIAGPAYVFLGVFQITLGGFRGSGSTRTAMLLSVQELWVFRIPLSFAFITVLGWGVIGVWYAVAISFVISALTTGAWFLRGTWTDNVVDPEDVDAPGDIEVADD